MYYVNKAKDKRLRIWIAILNTMARVGLFEKKDMSVHLTWDEVIIPTGSIWWKNMPRRHKSVQRSEQE